MCESEIRGGCVEKPHRDRIWAPDLLSRPPEKGRRLRGGRGQPEIDLRPGSLPRQAPFPLPSRPRTPVRNRPPPESGRGPEPDAKGERADFPHAHGQPYKPIFRSGEMDFLARDFEQAGADMIEANLTCPHIGLPAETLGEKVREELRSGGMIGQIPELCLLITRGLKEALRIPVVPKPYSNHPRFLESAKAIENGGADAISISSTMANCLPSPDLYGRGRPESRSSIRLALALSPGTLSPSMWDSARQRWSAKIPASRSFPREAFLPGKTLLKQSCGEPRPWASARTSCGMVSKRFRRCLMACGGTRRSSTSNRWPTFGVSPSNI